MLEQQQAQVGGNLMGSDHTYVIPGAKAGPGKKCAPHDAPCRMACAQRLRSSLQINDAAEIRSASLLPWGALHGVHTWSQTLHLICRTHRCSEHKPAALHLQSLQGAELWVSRARRGGAADVEVAIDPAELEGLDEEGVRALYEERLAQQQSTASREVIHSVPPHLSTIPSTVQTTGSGASRSNNPLHPARSSLPLMASTGVSQLVGSVSCMLQCPRIFPCAPGIVLFH